MTDTTLGVVGTLLAVGLGAIIAIVADVGGQNMTADTLRTAFTYGIATLILLGAFLLIYQGRGDSAQAWLAIGAVLGYVFRDAGGAAATGQVLRIQAAQPSPAAAGDGSSSPPTSPGAGIG